MSKSKAAMSLGAVMIVKNEVKNLGGILSDIHGVVDEICIVDTGSSDGTIALAESFGARIGHFPWNDDFSAARNHSLAIAQSDYLLWLDADDRIDEKDAKALLKLKAHLRPGKNRAYMLKILSRSEDMPDTLSFQTRIIPNRGEVRFEGRVHEQILPALRRAAITVEPLEITIIHTGYHDPDARRAKARRNLDILTDELKAGKDTASQHFFMAMACIGLEDFVQCLENLYKARQKRTDEDWLHFSYTISTDCLLRLGRTDEAHREISDGIAIFKESPLLHYYLGMVCMRAGRFTEAVAAFKKAAGLPQRPDSYPTPPDMSSTILFQHGKALEKIGKVDEAIGNYIHALKTGTRKKPIHHALGIALLQSGKIHDALLHLEKAKELSENIDIALWLSLAQIHCHLKHYDKSHSLYIDILHESPSHLHALVGTVDTSVELDDIGAFLNALEQLLLLLNIPIPDAVIDSLPECSDLCMKIVSRLKEENEPALAQRLAKTALRLDPSNSRAHLFLADLFAEKGETAQMLVSLETAVKCGANADEVRKRINKEPNPTAEPFLQVSRVCSFDEYKMHTARYRSKNLEHLAFEQGVLPKVRKEFVLDGYCYVCKKLVPFSVDYQYSYKIGTIPMPNWRERLVCPFCHLNNRMRATVHIFEQEFRPNRDSKIYITEQTTPLYNWFKDSYDHVYGSEYLGDSIRHGSCSGKGIRNEDLTRLTFADEEFDYILSFDVFEHVPEYKKALKECLRCLKPGGILYLSVPFSHTEEKNTVRAYVSGNGKVNHILPPEYHGDPLNSAGCLSFYNFGWEFLYDLEEIGFLYPTVLIYWSNDFGYLGGEQMLFTATKAV